MKKKLKQAATCILFGLGCAVAVWICYEIDMAATAHQMEVIEGGR